MEKNLEIRSFLARQFTRKVIFGNEHEYKISNTIGRHLMEGDRFEGLLYPTIASDFVGLNIAVKPDIANTYYKFNQVWVNRLEDVDNKRSLKIWLYKTCTF